MPSSFTFITYPEEYQPHVNLVSSLLTLGTSALMTYMSAEDPNWSKFFALATVATGYTLKGIIKDLNKPAANQVEIDPFITSITQLEKMGFAVKQMIPRQLVPTNQKEFYRDNPELSHLSEKDFSKYKEKLIEEVGKRSATSHRSLAFYKPSLTAEEYKGCHNKAIESLREEKLAQTLTQNDAEDFTFVY